jgi:hypothetical protein
VYDFQPDLSSVSTILGTSTLSLTVFSSIWREGWPRSLNSNESWPHFTGLEVIGLGKRLLKRVYQQAVLVMIVLAGYLG